MVTGRISEQRWKKPLLPSCLPSCSHLLWPCCELSCGEGHTTRNWKMSLSSQHAARSWGSQGTKSAHSHTSSSEAGLLLSLKMNLQPRTSAHLIPVPGSQKL
jgi:hypothetical protein